MTQRRPRFFRSLITRLCGGDRAMLALGAGSSTPWIVMGCLNTLLLPVLTTCYGIKASAVAWAVTIPRILGMILDPVIGHASDITVSRWGRRRPYIAAGAAGCAVSLAAMWWVPPGMTEGAEMGCFALASLVLWISFSVYFIPFGALCYEFTGDYNERIKLMTINSWFCILPGIASGWLYWIALRPAFGGELNGVRAITLALVPVILFFSLGPLLHAREVAVRPRQEDRNILRTLRETLPNRPFVFILLIRSSNSLGVWIFNGMMFYINAYYVFGGDKSRGTALSAAGATGLSILSMVAMPLTPALGRRIGKKGLLVAGAGCGLAGAVAMVFLTQPRFPWAQLAGIIFLAPSGFLQGIATSSIMPDICDLDELRHGTRREGFFNAIVASLTKVEVALALLVAGCLIDLSGFHPGLAVQSAATQLHLRIFAFAPFLVASVLSFALALHFPLTREQTGAIQGQLALRRLAAPDPSFQ